MWNVDTCTLTYFFQILNLKYTRKIKFINLSINIYAQYVKLDTLLKTLLTCPLLYINV